MQPQYTSVPVPQEIQSEIPYGYCQCGCGQKTKISDQSCTSKDWVKDQPRRFLKGHRAKWESNQTTLADRYSKFVLRGALDECWPWQAALVHGYGILSFQGQMLKAHRISYFLHYGELPDDLCVCHRCDNRQCVNPAHLFLGTYADNRADCVNKDRQSKGSKNGKSKLTPDQVQEIRRLYEMGRSQSVLARQFDISRSAISAIITSTNWGHLK